VPENVRNLLHQGDNSILLSVVLVYTVVLLVVLWIYTIWRMNGIKRQLTSITRGSQNMNLEEVLVGYLDKVENIEHRTDQVEQTIAVLQAKLPECIQRVNMIRYDAFEDVGGQQSFAIALLDGRGDGIVLTSVYSRMEIRVYAKAIRNGLASHQLSEEETRVLKDAAPH
jgi:hypothetical protein